MTSRCLDRSRGVSRADFAFQRGTAVPDGASAPVLQDRPRPVLTRHCWVTGLCPGRWAGLPSGARTVRPAAGKGRVVYAVDDGPATVIVEAWVPARHLQPAS